MSMALTQKDWLLISAFLDGRLMGSEKAAFESRLNSDADFNKAFHEIEYTRRLMRSLPQKRAPRNFTLSDQYVKKSSFKWGLNHLFGFASAASAVALTVIFAWTNLFVFQAKTAAPAPMMAALPEAAMDSSPDESSKPPMIIYWAPSERAYGMGGGGGSDDSAFAAKVMEDYGSEVPLENSLTAAATESPEASTKLAATPDPSTLILGLPEPGTEGEPIQQSTIETARVISRLPASILWMISLGAVSLVFAALAIFLRKR